VKRLFGRLRRLHDDVAARVPGADDEHAFAPELVGPLVLGRVNDLAVERAGHIGHLGEPVVPVGDDDGRVPPAPLTVGRLEHDVPPRARVLLVDRGHPDNGRR
jgi:hypothetical protein